MRHNRSAETIGYSGKSAHLRNAIYTLMTLSSLNGVACANASQATQPKMPVGNSTSSFEPGREKWQVAPISLINPNFDPDYKIQVVPLKIRVTPIRNVWPDVPVNCTYTGIVLEQDRLSEPHKILLENMCLQERGDEQNTFEGEHLWVSADTRGRFQIPFDNSYLEEKRNQLVFVFEAGSQRIEEPLSPGYESDTLTFAPSLNRHYILPIVGE